jgi:hypothetical protein
MDRGFDIPRVGGSKYHGDGVRYPMDRGGYTMGKGLDIPWVGAQNTMGRGFAFKVAVKGVF